MKNKVNYHNEPFEARIVNDFLPNPEQLVLRDKKQRVTLTLTQKSLDFFRSIAKKHKVSYQPMIRRLIDVYVANQTA